MRGVEDLPVTIHKTMGMVKKLFSGFLLFFFFVSVLSAQDIWKYFTPADFEARRVKVMNEIGDGIAILLGAELPEPFVKFRQDNNFYYLSGVETPDAILILDGRQKSSTLLVPEKASDEIKEEARIKPGTGAAAFYKMTRVFSKGMLTSILESLAKGKQPFFLQTAYAEMAEMSQDRSVLLWRNRRDDPWDGRINREGLFIKKIKEKFPGAVIKDLTPILDEMRWVKDQKEIAVIRECGRIGCLGFDEAMRITRPGLYEYQVVAACDFAYHYNGTSPAYFPIAASGERGLMWHYNANNHILKDGDVILLDYAPELNYYTTDITRTWPVSGHFSGIQLKFYNCIMDMREKVIAAMKPGITYADLQEVGKKVFEAHGFGKYWIGYVGHFVGMSVHDVGSPDKPFVPGVVFNVEPLIEDKKLKIHLRLEDTVVITETGAENLTPQSPVEPEAIYKLINEKGIWEK